MKQLLLVLIVFFPAITMAQNFIHVPVDSVRNLVHEVELSTGTKLQLRQRADSMENYLFRDSTWFVNVKLNLKNKNSLQGLKVIDSTWVDYIVISGPSDMMQNFFDKYLMTIKTKMWDAVIKDKKITNKDDVDIDGKAIWITEHYN